MPDREKVIKGLECCAHEEIGDCENCPYNENTPHCDISMMRDAIAMLKEQETSLEKVAADYGLTVDGVSFALDQYQTVISEITHGRMSKLSYYARDILSVANDVQCNGCELKEPQEPIKASIKDSDGGTTHWYVCGYCQAPIQPGDNFCHDCGKAVAWDD